MQARACVWGRGGWLDYLRINLCNEQITDFPATHFGDQAVASFTRKTRQTKCTVNCSNTVAMV